MARSGYERPLESFIDHALADEWHDFANEAVTAFLNRRRGLVYVATNPVHVGLFKVGSTAFDIQTRLDSLCSAGVTGEFHEVASFIAFDRFGAETRAQAEMAKTASRHKEFFVSDYRSVVEVVGKCVRIDNESITQAFPGIDIERV